MRYGLSKKALEETTLRRTWHDAVARVDACLQQQT